VTPFPYQHEGAKFLAAHPQALLADEMGLGKSCQAILACDMVNAHRILVCAPANARINWDREFNYWSVFSRPSAVLLGSRDTPLVKGAEVVLVSYDLIIQPKVLEALKKIQWTVLILDEAHLLKERTSKRTKAAYKHLAKQSAHVWRITGTPAPNDASELWTHLSSAGLFTLGYHKFIDLFCDGYDGGFGFKITGTKNVPQLKTLLNQFMIRRKKEDVATQLPPISFHNHLVEPSPVDEELFFADRFVAGGTRDAFHAELKAANDNLKACWSMAGERKQMSENRLSILEGLATPMSTLRRYVGLSKVPEVAKILSEELTTGAMKKVVIFAAHRDVIMLLVSQLKAFGAMAYFGGMDAHKKQRVIDRFQNEDRYRVFVGHIVAAGTAITLTQAHEVVIVEPSWVPAENAQAAMRCHRIGQTKPVRVRFFSIAGSIDESINMTLRRKTAELTKIFD